MYRVRLAAGDEKTYRSIDDMIWDVETGVITRDALLFHAGSQSWVSITRNPRLAVRLKAEPRPGEAPLEFEPLSDVILADAL
ncbi:MAG TPA: hypothetical protein VFX50_06095, partial [Gemmatimonadales bacterium]|nr:hypothetical protein [Gemmatimonadales bacterium]